MAKKKAATGGITKSQAIRDQVQANPNATGEQIAEAASKQVGEPVSIALVYQVKTKDAAKKPRRKKTAARQAPATSGKGASLQLVKEAVQLLQHAGDSKAAREALNAAEDISRMLKK